MRYVSSAVTAAAGGAARAVGYHGTLHIGGRYLYVDVLGTLCVKRMTVEKRHAVKGDDEGGRVWAVGVLLADVAAFFLVAGWFRFQVCLHVVCAVATRCFT